VVRDKSSNSNHGKTSILKFLQLKLLLLSGILRPKLKVVNSWRSSSKEGLSRHFLVVLPRLEDTADNDKLTPPLRIGLKNGIDGISGGNVCGVEGSEDFGEEPSDGGEHGGAAIGEFGSTGPVGWDVVTEATRVPNSAAVHTKTTMKTAIIATLVGSAAAFAPSPVARVESSLSYAKELDSMAGVSNEVGGKVVCVCGRFL